jgi:hypothetical protein
MPYQPKFDDIIDEEMKKLKKMKKSDLVEEIEACEFYTNMFEGENLHAKTKDEIVQRVKQELDQELEDYQENPLYQLNVPPSDVMNYLIGLQQEGSFQCIDDWGRNEDGTWKYPLRGGGGGGDGEAMVKDLEFFLDVVMNRKSCPLHKIYEALRPKWGGIGEGERNKDKRSYQAAVRDRLQDRGYVNAINNRGTRKGRVGATTFTPQLAKRNQNPKYKNNGKIVFCTSMNLAEKGWKYITQKELSDLIVEDYNVIPHIKKRRNTKIIFRIVAEF